VIVIDTSSLQRYLAGFLGRDTKAVSDAIARHDAYLPPVVVTEALSNPFLSADGAGRIQALPVVDLLDGYWIRAGEMRADLLRQQRKAKLGDALIAQVCLDYGSPLITFDDDFDNFVDLGLILL
jgi:predicted nucleic acid-binding protein